MPKKFRKNLEKEVKKFNLWEEGRCPSPPPKLVGFHFSLKNFVPQKCLSKNDLVRNNFGQGNKNCLETVRLRLSDVSHRPPPPKNLQSQYFPDENF